MKPLFTFASFSIFLLLFGVVAQGNLLDTIQSNINEAVQPAEDAAASFFGQIGSNVASVVDHAGDVVQSVASHAVSDFNSNQNEDISSQLSSYYKSDGASAILENWTHLAAIAAIYIAFCTSWF
ncbi:hypothetical protein GGI26_006036 [Coemansia sp. RSA 1358]|uniref:Uncharacterized protein n=1 Tax=Coemansia umbellata TaxID=1424467 RepID=A0ABQ8PI83_9FUNG|nr:hypothetical protein EDC05_004624 [Coemansia umbellata]KAJ2619188.1 hypothetical protein GGI26_006036 [Coemansia sp. RSA 1358]